MKTSVPSLVSVVIPFYNHGDFIEETLESLKNQRFQNFEIIVVDDCSPDKKSQEIIHALPQKYDRLQVLQSPQNSGPGFCRNFGASRAKGEYIIPLDADDCLAPEFIHKCLRAIEAEKLDFVTTDLQNFGASDRIWRAKINFYDQLFDARITGCALFRKKVFEQVGGYDAAMREGFEDWEFWIRVLKNGFRGTVIREPLFYYRRKPVSRLEETHLKRARYIRAIREKHPDLYTRKKKKEIKKQWPGHYGFLNTLHETHYQISRISPKLGYFLMKLYFRIKD